jgi:two-component system, chemotaxis family, chemotaxis protein CheY
MNGHQRTGKTILVVDDSTSIRQMLTLTLEKAGYNVLQGADGQDGLNQLASSSVSLIISDINMPVMDGYTFVRRARSLEHCKTTPILILTTESGADKKTLGRESGASGWIVKPFSPDKLLQAIAKLIP